MGAFKANRQGNPFLAARRSLLCQSLRARQRSLEIAKNNANGLGAHWPSWAATGIDGRIYAVAYDPEVYDPVSGVWWFLPPLPTSRAYLAGATDRDGQIYALGGCWMIMSGGGFCSSARCLRQRAETFPVWD